MTEKKQVRNSQVLQKTNRRERRGGGDPGLLILLGTHLYLLRSRKDISRLKTALFNDRPQFKLQGKLNSKDRTHYIFLLRFCEGLESQN